MQAVMKYATQALLVAVICAAASNAHAQDASRTFVTFPANVANKVGLAAGEEADVEITVIGPVPSKGKRADDRLVEFFGVSDSGALIAGTGTLRLERQRRRIPTEYWEERGKIALDALEVLTLDGAEYFVDSGTLDYMSYWIFGF